MSSQEQLMYENISMCYSSLSLLCRFLKIYITKHQPVNSVTWKVITGGLFG